jgi:hypothetical protein
MISLAQIQKLARVREVERRLAAVSLAASTTQMRETETRMVRLKQLSRAVVIGPGLRTGAVLASGSECVSRLLIGCIATLQHRSRQIEQEEIARHSFAIADARARIAQRHVVTIARASAKEAELRAALKMPVRGITTCP